jgi:hypothetical protein
MNQDFATVERLAAELCAIAGGDWSRKRTKRNLWRRRVLALIALANGDKDEAQRAMTTTRAQGEG